MVVPSFLRNEKLYYYYYYYIYHLCAGYLQLNISETNHVSIVYNFAAILCLQIMIHVMLFPMMYDLYFAINAFRSRCAVTNMAVLYIILTLCFPGMLLRYFLNNLDIDPVAHITTGITFIF